jgi:hypothetical protein
VAERIGIDIGLLSFGPSSLGDVLAKHCLPSANCALHPRVPHAAKTDVYKDKESARVGLETLLSSQAALNSGSSIRCPGTHPGHCNIVGPVAVDLKMAGAAATRDFAAAILLPNSPGWRGTHTEGSLWRGEMLNFGRLGIRRY